MYVNAEANNQPRNVQNDHDKKRLKQMITVYHLVDDNIKNWFFIAFWIIRGQCKRLDTKVNIWNTTCTTKRLAKQKKTLNSSTEQK